jgi:hypothetical protein
MRSSAVCSAYQILSGRSGQCMCGHPRFENSDGWMLVLYGKNIMGQEEDRSSVLVFQF